MAVLYPYGYAGAMRTLGQQAATTTVQRLHPEVWRRMSALMQEAADNGVQLGVGTGWRRQPTNPDGTPKPGFAAPGNSYHEGFMPGGRTRPDGVNDRNAMAIDTVLTGAWPWMNANCGRFGFVHFANVNSEPWHIQPVEIPRSRNFATAEPALRVWPLEEGIIVTPEDKAYLDAMRAAIINSIKVEVPKALVSTPWVADKSTPLGEAIGYAVRNTATLYNATDGTPQSGKMAGQSDATAAAVATLDPDAITAAVTAAVMEALEDVTINADLSNDDIAKIAAATTAAVVAEIAS